MESRSAEVVVGWYERLFGKKPPEPEPSDAARDLVRRAYGGQEPFCFGAQIAFADGGPDPLDAVEIYWHETGPHWHYVGFGLAPFGFELGFRLAARPEDRGTEPARFLGSIAYNAPTWPILMLNMLARRVHRTKRPFRAGEWWQGQEGVLRPHAEFTFLAFAQDPELGALADGSVRFLLATAIDSATVDAMKADETAGRGDATLDRLRAADPLLVTHLERFQSPPSAG